MLDLNSHIDVEQDLAVTELDTDGTTDGGGVDLAGYDAAVVVVTAGTWATDGTYTPKVQESADDSTYTDVDEDDLDGSFAAISSAATDNLVQQVGYHGNSRYIRVRFTTASNTSGTLPVASAVIRSKARKLT